MAKATSTLEHEDDTGGHNVVSGRSGCRIITWRRVVARESQSRGNPVADAACPKPSLMGGSRRLRLRNRDRAWAIVVESSPIPRQP